MKKLFTTFLLMGIALCGWAQSSGTEVVQTVDYSEIDWSGNTPSLDNIVVPDANKGKVTKLVLTGAFSNKDFLAGGTVEEIVKKVRAKADGQTTESPNIFLDLSGCTGIYCKVEYTGKGDVDWTSDDFKYVYTSEQVDQPVTKETKRFYNGSLYEGDYKTDNDGKKYFSKWYDGRTLYEGDVTELDGYDVGKPYLWKWYDTSTEDLYEGNIDELTETSDPNVKYYVRYYDGKELYDETTHGAYSSLPSDDKGSYYQVWTDVDSNTPYVKDDLNDLPLLDPNNPDVKYYSLWYDGENLYEGSMETDDNGSYYSTWLFNGEEPNDENIWMVNSLIQNGYVWYRDEVQNDHGKWVTSEDGLTSTYTFYRDWYNGPGEYEHGPECTITKVKHYLTEERHNVENRKFYVEERVINVENRKCYLTEDKQYLEEENVWFYTETKQDNNGQTIVKTIIVADDKVTATDATHGTTQIADPNAAKFSFENFNVKDKISGIAFPTDADKFTAIPDKLFLDQKGLQTVEIGSNVIWIGSNAFKNTGLTEVDLPTGLKVIDGEAFAYTKLTEIDLGDCTSLVAIKYEAFEACKDAETLTFPSGSTLTFIGNDAFKELVKLETLDMKNCTGITEFQSKNDDEKTYKTFYGCTALTTVTLPPNLTAIPDDYGMGVFQACGAIETLTFTGTPSYNECTLLNPCTIGDNAFAFNRSLTTITFSKNISYIGYQAFHSAAIQTVSIPASVKDLAKHSFYGCTQLKTVIFEAFDKKYGTCDGEATRVAGAQGAGGQGQGAFEECQAITDVYINTMAELDCLNNAFDQDISWGAGDAGANFATLHFPKEKTEHYVNLQHYLTDEIVTNPGEFHKWLEAHYDQAINPHKNGWYEFINSGPTTPEDGPTYQSIILRTFSDKDYAYLVPSGIRAYVVNKVELLSDGNYEVSLQRLNVIPKNTGVILYGHPNGKTQGGKAALVMTPVKFLEYNDPLYDQKYVDGKLVKCEIEYNDDGTMVVQDTYKGKSQGAALCRANWGDLDEAHMMYKNYLEPILSANGKDNVPLRPYETVNVNGVNKVKFRNFGLGRYSSTDYITKGLGSPLNDETNYVGFFRLKPQSYKSGYAYLHLAGDVDEEGRDFPYTITIDGNEKTYASEFPLADAGEILVKPDEPAVDLTNNVYPYYWEVMIKDGIPYNARGKNMGDATYNPKRWWDEDATPNAFTWNEYELSWGSRSDALVDPTQIAKYFGEFEENADGVVKVVIPVRNEDDAYYTIQGVRVTNPITKGVYIHNGKKVIVK